MSDRKKKRLGILFPDGDINYILFMSPTKDGFTYGVDYSDTHITLLPEPDSVSFHSTNQKTGKSQSLGRIWKDKDYTDLEIQALNPRKIAVEDYDKTVIHVTEAGESLANQSTFDMIERVTKKEIIQLWDIKKLFDNAYRVAQKYVESPDSYFGICTVGELISNPDYVYGVTENEKIVIEFDGEWLEIELSHYYNLTGPNHPFEEMLSSIGIQELLPEIQKRIQEVFHEKAS